MPATTPPISLRLPETMKERLDRMAKKMHCSRSSLMIEALERHLDDIQQSQTQKTNQGKFSELLKFKGAGVKVSGARNPEEIDASIRDFRGDE